MPDMWGSARYFNSVAGQTPSTRAGYGTPAPSQQFNPPPSGNAAGYGNTAPQFNMAATQAGDGSGSFLNRPTSGTPYMLARPGQPYDPSTMPSQATVAGNMQAYKNNQITSLLQQGDEPYQQAIINLGAQLGLSNDQMGYQKQGNQLTHDQDAAFQNMIINNYGRDAGFINTQLGLAGQTRDQDLARQGLSDQSIGLNENDLLTNLYRSRRQLNNQYTAGGGWFTPERGLSQNDLNQGWVNSQGQLNIQRAGNQINRQSIGTQYSGAQLAHDKALAALGDTDAQARLKLQFGDQNLQHANAGADLQHNADVLQNSSQGIQLAMQQAANKQKLLAQYHDEGIL